MWLLPRTRFILSQCFDSQYEKKERPYFPQIFLIPFGLFLFSGDNGDCGPESVPRERGERSSETTVPSMFSVSPGLRESHFTLISNQVVIWEKNA